MPYKPIIWVVPMIAIISLVGFVADGFVGFVDVVALLVVDGFVGFAGGWWLQGLWVLLGRWSSIFFFCLFY